MQLQEMIELRLSTQEETYEQLQQDRKSNNVIEMVWKHKQKPEKMATKTYCRVTCAKNQEKGELRTVGILNEVVKKGIVNSGVTENWL